MIVQYGLGFGAGLLSLLAPCVLPLIPIIFGSSVQSSKFGPNAFAIGLTLSFTLVGILTSLFSSIQCRYDSTYWGSNLNSSRNIFYHSKAKEYFYK